MRRMLIAIYFSAILLFQVSVVLALFKGHPNVVNNVTRKTTYIRGCYFTNWAQYRQGRAKYLPEDYIPGLCSHIFYAFGYINDNYTVRNFDLTDLPTEWAGIGLYARINNLKKLDKKLKTILSFGGWSFGTRIFSEMSSTAEKRSVFVNSVTNFVRRYGFDGIDIDWEYPDGAKDAASFTALMKDLWEGVKLESEKSARERLLLAAAVSASKEKINKGYQIANFAPYVDFVLLMSYDFHGAWEPVTGPNSPLYSPTNAGDQWDLDSAAAYWVNGGMPREKIIIGVASYGRGWTLDDSTTTDIGAPGKISRITNFVGEPGIAAYFEICEWLANKEAVRRWDWIGKVPYLIHGDQWYSYDDTESVQAKIEWMKKKRYGGIFVWTLDFDDFNGNCTASGGVKFPIASTIAQMLGDMEPLQDDYSSISLSSSAIPSLSTSITPFPEMDDFCLNLSDGHHMHPLSCTKFILCLNSSSFVFDCPQNLHFNSKLQHCVIPENNDSLEQCRTGDSGTNLLSTNSASVWTTATVAVTIKDLIVISSSLQLLLNCLVIYC